MKRFPPEDLCNILIDLYFTYSNTYFPLLHRPTFQKQWEDKLHETNFWFAASCLMLFAVGSRWCTDERVLGDPEDRDGADHNPSPPSGQSGESKNEGSSEKPTVEQPGSSGKKWWTAGLPFFDTARGNKLRPQFLAFSDSSIRGDPIQRQPNSWYIIVRSANTRCKCGAYGCSPY